MSNVPTTFEGPVCNLNAKVNVQQPTMQSAPQIPVANDLPSALQAIQNITQILQTLVNQLPGQNNTQQNTPQRSSQQASPGGDFHQVPGSMVTQPVRIYNPDNPQQYVDVAQVTHVQFANKLGIKLTYSNPVGG